MPSTIGPMECHRGSTPPLRRAASASEIAWLESRGELPLLEDEAPELIVSTPPVLEASPPLLPVAPPSLTHSEPRAPSSPVWAPVLTRQASRSYANRRAGRNSLKGPLRAARLCLLAVLLPGLLVAGPLYLRFHVYSDQVYPLAMSDMRLLDGRVSTTWCQRQVVRANTTFNAFLLPEQPHVAPEPQRVSMVRDLVLDDDMKEYWAFYLLRGSSITVSACVSSPGASLIVIRGHKHLHDCAYIGDDSSEEVDEAAEAEAEAQERRDAKLSAATAAAAAAAERGSRPVAAHSSADSADVDDDGDARERAVRRLARPGVQLLGAQAPLQSQERLEQPHAHEPDPEDGALRHILHKVAQKRVGTSRWRGGDSSEFQVAGGPIPPHTAASRARPVAGAPSSSEVFEEVLRKLRALGPRGGDVLRRLNHQLNRAADAGDAAAATAATATAAAAAASPPATAAAVGAPEGAPANDTLAEALQEPGAVDALRELVRRLLEEHAAATATEATLAGRHRRASPAPHLPRAAPEISSAKEAVLESEARVAAHYWSGGEDEEDNKAMEEQDLQPDGIADHHMRLNETETGDLDSSNSEFWSSFSSSEEALMSCKGLVLNLPLHPHHACRATTAPGVLRAAASRNTLTYRIPANGYYFFVFSSENEVQANYIQAHFHLERVVYNVSSPVAACRNSTQPCALSLDFFSNEKLVLEMPVRANASLWNEEFLVVSSCEPRTALYVACIVAVPMLIVLFAFQ